MRMLFNKYRNCETSNLVLIDEKQLAVAKNTKILGTILKKIMQPSNYVAFET